MLVAPQIAGKTVTMKARPSHMVVKATPASDIKRINVCANDADAAGPAADPAAGPAAGAPASPPVAVAEAYPEEIASSSFEESD
eukprot:3333355-Pyramimonas_sp.AAC.1